MGIQIAGYTLTLIAYNVLNHISSNFTSDQLQIITCILNCFSSLSSTVEVPALLFVRWDSTKCYRIKMAIISISWSFDFMILTYFECFIISMEHVCKKYKKLWEIKSLVRANLLVFFFISKYPKGLRFIKVCFYWVSDQKFICFRY